MAGLTQAGHTPVHWPLMDIGPPHDLAPVQAAWSRWSTWHAVMFVSAQAVRLFFAQRPAGLTAPVPMPRCWATGMGTRRALQEVGVPETHIDSPSASAAQFDSETLWTLVRGQVQPGQSVLIVRGNDASHEGESPSDSRGAGRDWLGEQLKAQGAHVQWLAAYERRAPAWSAAQRTAAQQAAQDGSVWLFSSSQAIGHLADLLPGVSWSQARALATHPRIAQAAQDVGFGHVAQVRPVIADVLASLESMA